LAARLPHSSGKKIGSNLVALGSAAVVAVYAAGYLRTRAAAQRFSAEPAQRKSAAPAAIVGAAPVRDERASVRSAEGPRAASPLTSANKTKSKREKKSEPLRAQAQPAAVPGAPLQATAATVPPPANDRPPATVPAPAPPPPVPAPKPAPQYKDGTYSGWGTSRHGDIQASVVIDGGRIAAAAITQCLTRYSCSWIAHLQGQVVTRQSADVDFVSGATQSTNAFYYAILEALAKAK
jgi:uncharacterized protein with FMN-binding domain